jgi:hypothetical protein
VRAAGGGVVRAEAFDYVVFDERASCPPIDREIAYTAWLVVRGEADWAKIFQ